MSEYLARRQAQLADHDRRAVTLVGLASAVVGAGMWAAASYNLYLLWT